MKTFTHMVNSDIINSARERELAMQKYTLTYTLFGMTVSKNIRAYDDDEALERAAMLISAHNFTDIHLYDPTGRELP